MSTEDRVNKTIQDLTIAGMVERSKDIDIPEIKGVHLKTTTIPDNSLGLPSNEELLSVLKTADDMEAEQWLSAFSQPALAIALDDTGIDKSSGVAIHKEAATAGSIAEDGVVLSKEHLDDMKLKPFEFFQEQLKGGVRSGDFLMVGAYYPNQVTKSTLNDFISIQINKRRAAKEEALKNPSTEKERDLIMQRTKQRSFINDLDVCSAYAYQHPPYAIQYNKRVVYTIIRADSSNTIVVEVCSVKKHNRKLSQLRKAIAHSKGDKRVALKAGLKNQIAIRKQVVGHINNGLLIRRTINLFDTLEAGKTIVIDSTAEGLGQDQNKKE